MSRSGMHKALVDELLDGAYRPDGTRETVHVRVVSEPSRTVRFAQRLNDLCEMRKAGTLSSDEFATLLRDLGVAAEPAFYLELAIAGGSAPKEPAHLATDFDDGWWPQADSEDGER